MKLSQSQFFSYPVTKSLKLSDSGREHKTPYIRYEYESGTTLYSVDVRSSDGDKTYHVNAGFSTEPRTIHRKIEKFFCI